MTIVKIVKLVRWARAAARWIAYDLYFPTHIWTFKNSKWKLDFFMQTHRKSGGSIAIFKNLDSEKSEPLRFVHAV